MHEGCACSLTARCCLGTLRCMFFICRALSQLHGFSTCIRRVAIRNATWVLCIGSRYRFCRNKSVIVNHVIDVTMAANLSAACGIRHSWSALPLLAPAFVRKSTIALIDCRRYGFLHISIYHPLISCYLNSRSVMQEMYILNSQQLLRLTVQSSIEAALACAVAASDSQARSESNCRTNENETAAAGWIIRRGVMIDQ